MIDHQFASKNLYRSHLRLSLIVFDKDNLERRISELDRICGDPEIWVNPTEAANLLKEQEHLNSKLRLIIELTGRYENIVELLTLMEEANDIIMIEDTYKELLKLEQDVKSKELECFFRGECDANPCFLEVHSGAGGTEGDDWANMLLRMYSRWATNSGYDVKLVYKLDGEEVGVKSAIIRVEGWNAYGRLRTESGIHRLVRISPYSKGKRHTTFASVWVYPIVEDNVVIDIAESDLRIDTYRSSGAGGQHVNTTDSAVRITHLPTGIVVQSQNNRSQHRNRDECMEQLRARLYEVEQKRKREKIAKENDAKDSIGWGNQRRSYVLHPYQMVKDLYSGYETGDSEGVLNGEIDELIYQSLKCEASRQNTDK